MILPLLIGAVSIIGSIIGTFFVRLGGSQSIMGALYKGLAATGLVSGLGAVGVINYLFGFDRAIGVGGATP